MEQFAIDNPAFEDETEVKEDSENDKKSPEKSKGDIISRSIERFWTFLGNIYEKNKKKVIRTSLVALIILFLAYFGGALRYKIVYDCEGAQTCHWEWCDEHGLLIILTALVVVGVLYFQVVKKYFGPVIIRIVEKQFSQWWNKWRKKRIVRVIVYAVPIILILLYVIIDTAGSRKRLSSFLGLIVFLLLGAVFSKHPGKIQWQPVISGMLMQFICGLLTLRWETGRNIFQCFGDKVTRFLEYTYEGAGFVYGQDLSRNVFAFQVLPVIFFFSFFVQILYYLGVMQLIVMKMGWILQVTMGTTVCESVNTAASIFLGQSEAPLVIKPYIPDLTKSEIHAVMTAGFSTVSGSVLAAYISFGIEASHLLTASIMSAPAALCYAKLFYPESEKSKTQVDNIQLKKGDEAGLLDAATKGAMSGISLVLGIIANLVAFVSAIAFLDGIVGWMGELVGLTGENAISFTYILTQIFYPLAWLMGVPTEQCPSVAKIVALKTVVNEFVAYEELGKLIKEGAIFGRSEIIATYALCGFSNPGSIGIIIGALSSMAPERRSDIAEVAFRAFLSGCAVCFLTACVAGVLVEDSTLN